MHTATSKTTSARLTRAFVAAATVSLGAALLAPTAASASTTSDQKARPGQLGWGFKESFREYIEGPIADGGIEVTAPAVRLEDGTFRWSKGRGSVDTEADTASLRFQGEVYFYGHDAGSGPALQIWLDEPRLDLDGDSGVVVADVISRSLSSGELVEYDDVQLADLDLTGTDLAANRKGVVKLDGIPSVLTEDGAAAFAGFYPAGTQLDPVNFRVKLRS